MGMINIESSHSEGQNNFVFLYSIQELCNFRFRNIIIGLLGQVGINHCNEKIYSRTWFVNNRVKGDQIFVVQNIEGTNLKQCFYIYYVTDIDHNLWSVIIEHFYHAYIENDCQLRLHHFIYLLYLNLISDLTIYYSQDFILPLRFFVPLLNMSFQLISSSLGFCINITNQVKGQVVLSDYYQSFFISSSSMYILTLSSDSNTVFFFTVSFVALFKAWMVIAGISIVRVLVLNFLGFCGMKVKIK